MNHPKAGACAGHPVGIAWFLNLDADRACGTRRLPAFVAGASPVERAGSLSQNFGFTRYRMPRGGRLRLVDPGGREIASFTDKNNKSHGQLWTPIVPGIRATVEVTVPSNVESYLDLALTQVNSAFRGFQHVRRRRARKGFPAKSSLRCVDE